MINNAKVGDSSKVVLYKKYALPRVMVHTFNPCTLDIETGRSLSLNLPIKL